MKIQNTPRETTAATTGSSYGLTAFRSAFLFAFMFFAFAISASASHFRYGLITATRLSETSTTVTYRFNVNLSWRLTTAPASASFGISGGNTGSFNVTMTNVTDPSGGWTNGTGVSANITLNKTTTPTRVTFTSCCKLSTISNNHDGNWDVYTILNTSAPGSTPISTMPAIINMPVNASAVTFTVPASDPDAGSTLTFGTPNFTTGNLATQTEPAGFSLNSTTGTITMSTIGKTVGQQYNAMVTVTDNNGNQIMLDFLINMVGASNPPVFVYSVTPTNGTVYNVIAGQTLTFPIRAKDDDAGSSVSLSASGLTSAITTANFSPSFPATGNPANTTFTYTPTTGHVGNSTVLTFIATDNVGVQSNSSVTINVVAEPAPTFISPTPGQGTIRSILTGATHNDTIRAQSSLGSNVSIAYATIPTGASLSPSVPTTGANPGQTIMAYTPTASQFGVKNLTFQATISGYSTIYSTRNYQLLVNTLPEFTSTPVTTATPCTTYSYTVTASDANVGYGDTVEIEAHGGLPSWLTLTQTGMGTAVLSGNPTSSDIGTHHITLVAADLYHHNYDEVEQEFDIVVTADETAPSITAPSAITVYANSGSCSATGYSLGSATATDNCAVASVTNNDAGTYSVGTHTITWTATDVNSNTATATQTITVVDNQNPTITAPANVTVNANSGICNATGYDLGTATTADNCGVASVTNNDAGTYAVGTHTITWTVTDVNGNTATATQTITVVDNQNPTITAPANITVNANSGACSATGYSLGTATTADNCGVASVSNNDAGTYNIGTHTITWTVTDVNGNTATATQTITVVDNQNPAVATQNVTVYLSSGGTASITPTQINNGSTDNCGITSMSVTPNTFTCSDITSNNRSLSFNGSSSYVQVSGNIPGGNTFSYSSWFKVSNSGNGKLISSGAFEVCVCSGQIQVYTPTGSSYGGSVSLNAWHNLIAVYNYPTMKVYLDGSLISTFTAGTIGTISNPRIGRHVSVNCCWINGLIDETSTWNIALTSTQIANLQSQALTGNESGLTALWNFEEGTGTTLVDHSSNGRTGTLYNMTSSSWSSSHAPVSGAGTKNVTLAVTDVNGNTATGTAVVTVVDTLKPTITAPSAITVNANSGSCNATGYSLGTPSTADNCGIAGVTNNNTGSYAVGTHTITWTATDLHGNSATATQTITVVDNQNPTITAPANVTVNANSGACNATGYSLGTATTADNCGVASVTNNDAGTYSVGTHNITWTVTDVHGNTASATQTITVVDNQNPTITAPASITVNANSGACNATGYDLGSATTADNCGVASVTSDDAGTYSVGTHTITWTVTDVNGNTATATQTITVVDNQNPTITAPANVTVNANSGVCNATGYDLGTATTADNCGVASVTNNDAGTYAVGTHTITWTVTDVNGNSATATQTITVVDNQNPTITAPANVTVNANSGVCNATGYSIGSATTADNCGVASVTNNDAGTYAVGTHNITWTVTDVNGNSATATQTITVVDNQNPVASCQNYTLNLSGGSGSITASDVNNGSYDNCGIASMSVSPSTFTCANAGANTVTLTVTDVNGNVSTCNATVTVQYQPSASISVTPSNTTYTGGIANNIYLGYGPQSATLTANGTGGSGFTYSWTPGTRLSCTTCQSPVFTPTAAGTYVYTVTVTNSNGCSTTATVSMCVIDARDASNSNKVILCHVPPGNPSNPQTLSIASSAVPSHLTNHTGDRLGSCASSCGTSAKEGMPIAAEVVNENNFSMLVYPNPSTSDIHVDIESEISNVADIVIFDITGRVVEMQKAQSTSTSITVGGNLPAGMYILEVRQNEVSRKVKITKL